jgi:hypothetical protein
MLRLCAPRKNGAVVQNAAAKNGASQRRYDFRCPRAA